MAKDKHRHEREKRERQDAKECAAMGATAVAAELEVEDKVEKTVKTAEVDSGAETAGDERDSAAQAEIEALNDRLKRTLAEFENLRKRSEREKAQMFDLSAKSVLEKSLPVIDNFEYSVAQAPEGEDSGIKAHAEGIGMVHRQLLKNLKEVGVEAINAKGGPFGPAYHNAVMHEDNETLGENVVLEELQKGYPYKDSVPRHSMAKVAN